MNAPGGRAQPEQKAPPVQRLRVRYAKRGRLRFASHRDFARAFERALVRARLPMAYSSGFNPHPRISYAGAAPTGASSEAEYLEIGLAERVDPEAVRTLLDDALPDGFDVLAVAESAGGALADRLQASRWGVVLPAPAELVVAAVSAFLAAEEVRVQRMTKKGLRDFDARAAVLALRVVTPGAAPTPEGGEPEIPTGASDEPADAGVEVEMVLRHVEPAVRPDDVVAGLSRFAGLEVDAPPRITRWEQGPWDAAAERIEDPLA